VVSLIWSKSIVELNRPRLIPRDADKLALLRMVGRKEA
jgi:hypothetical protein